MLRFRRNAEHEQAIRELYESRGMPPESVPVVHYGYDGETERLHVLTSREEWAPGDERWHLSISAPERVPTWNEITEAIHALRPGVPMVLGVPPRSWWMNLHPYVLHAWECKDWNLIAEWRANRTHQAPT
jgi:hypothetical protein